MIYRVYKLKGRGYEVVKENGVRICTVATKRSAISIANDYSKKLGAGFVVYDTPRDLTV